MEMSRALARPGTINREPRTRPGAGRGRGAVHAVARWLRHALADVGRAWALAAGVPPHLSD